MFLPDTRALAGVLLLLLFSGINVSQTPKDDVIRINTELVQTSVTVTDKNGKFVDGLSPDQFQLVVDGKPYEIRFLEHVIAGTSREQQLTAGQSAIEPTAASSKVSQRGRTIIFFVDDLHLGLDSLDRSRETIRHFIDHEMGNRDYVAISSASGQVGFLQQFTNNKAVLKAAVDRLTFKPNLARGFGMSYAPMSEYMAYLIDSRSDPKLLDVYILECLKNSSAPKKLGGRSAEAIRMSCETQVKSNARAILIQSAAITEDTYNSLDSLIESSARLPGRKLAFFFSDGFLLDVGPRGRDVRTKLENVIDAALHAGVVVYTIDAKGLVSTAVDATNNRVMDPNGRLESAHMREIAATQDALHALAGDTGGRALRNQNTFDRWINKVLDETSNYYLLAWRPEPDEQKEKKFHKVEIAVIGRPELTVRVPRGYFEGSKVPTTSSTSEGVKVAATANNVPKTPDVDLRDALTDSQPTHGLPTLLALSYLSTPANGMVVTSSMQIASRRLDYGAAGTERATVDLAGVVLNDKGKVVTSFKKRLNIDPPAKDADAVDSSAVIFNHRAQLPPGIYQVRVAAREARSSRVGSAMDWIVVPNLQSHELALSSLLIGGKVLESTAPGTTQEAQVQLSVDRRFTRNSKLPFWLFIYNAMKDGNGTGKPNLAVQVQVLRDGRSLVTTPQRTLRTDGMLDLDRIPYGGDVALNSLAAGRYELRVTVTDLVAHAAKTLSSEFEVE